MLLKTVQKTIEEHSLLKKGDKVLCAVSGGADSVCLLNVLSELKDEYKLSLYVANVNHLLRGDEADHDSNFVKNMCESMGIKCFYREYDVRKIASEMKIGEEECGRILRYNFFNEISESLGGAKIATAHNLGDNAETVLFRLVRGSSALGLSGIKYKRDNIIRPLLDVTRKDIEKYLTEKGVSWCVDSTNNIPKYTRNKLRLKVMPLLEEITEKAEERIVSAAKLISEDEQYLSSLSETALDNVYFKDYILAEKMLTEPLPIMRRLVATILKEWGVKEVTSEKIQSFIEFSSAESGKCFDINSLYFAEKVYGKICLRERNGKTEQFLACLDTEISVQKDGWLITATITDTPPGCKGNNIAIFDADKLSLPLTVRYKRDGDKLSPKGMNGTKKVSDIFTDLKIDKNIRQTVPIVEKNGDILFLAGLRQTALFNTDENTKRYLTVKYTKDNF